MSATPTDDAHAYVQHHFDHLIAPPPSNTGMGEFARVMAVGVAAQTAWNYWRGGIAAQASSKAEDTFLFMTALRSITTVILVFLIGCFIFAGEPGDRWFFVGWILAAATARGIICMIRSSAMVAMERDNVIATSEHAAEEGPTAH